MLVVLETTFHPGASSASGTCSVCILEGNEIGSIFCHASKIDLKSPLKFRLLKFGSEELEELELHLLGSVGNPNFLVFQQQLCFEVWFAEGKVFAIFKTSLCFLFHTEEIRRKAGGKNSLNSWAGLFL